MNRDYARKGFRNKGHVGNICKLFFTQTRRGGCTGLEVIDYQWSGRSRTLVSVVKSNSENFGKKFDMLAAIPEMEDQTLAIRFSSFCLGAVPN